MIEEEFGGIADFIEEVQEVKANVIHRKEEIQANIQKKKEKIFGRLSKITVELIKLYKL